MKLQTESYDAFGVLQPKETLEIASNFAVDDDGSFGFPEPVVLGLWIQRSGNQVEPRYLTETQRNDVLVNPISKPTKLIADPLDSDLGPEAESVQYSLRTIWKQFHDDRLIMLQTLCWGYSDYNHHYAENEVEFLWEIARILYQENS